MVCDNMSQVDKKCILVVDDQPNVLESVALLLDNFGYDVVRRS